MALNEVDCDSYCLIIECVFSYAVAIENSVEARETLFLYY